MRETIAVVVSFALLGCAACDEARVSLSVDLKTDFVAGIEFAGVHTEVFGTAATDGTPTATLETLARSESFLTPRRVAEFSGVAPGEHAVVVRLLDAAGGEIASRVTIVTTRESSVSVLVVIPRRSAECTTAADCPEPAACARALCEDNACLYTSTHDDCPDGQWCNPESGCQPLPVLGDAGAPDAGPTLGSTCTTDADCGGAVCFPREALALPGTSAAGLCTTPCCSHADCPMGTICWTPGTGTRACVPPDLLDPSGPPPWTPCVVDADCPGGVCRLSGDVTYAGRTSRQLECGDPVGTGRFGDPCTASGDCQAGICAAIDGEQQCTEGCAITADCAGGSCVYFRDPGGGTAVPLCARFAAPGSGETGDPCLADTECVDRLCATGRCAGTCCRDAHCPSGMRCRPLDVGGSWQLRCR